MDTQNKIVASEDKDFKNSKDQMICHYSSLDISEMDLFKIVKDNKLVDEEDLRRGP